MEIKSRQKGSKKINIDLTTGKILKQSKNEFSGRKQAIIYCRVSSSKQVKEGDGLASQEQSCRDWCNRNGADVVMVFKDEGISGTNLERQGINDAIHYLQEQNKKSIKIHYFICTEESRISRSSNLLETLEMDGKIGATGADLVFTFSGGVVNKEDDGQNARKQMKFVIASQELKRIRKRALNGKITKLKEGKRPYRSLVVGYQKIKKGTESFIIKDEYADKIKNGFEMYANDVLLTDKDLYDYRIKEGVQTEEKRYKGKLHFSFIGKQFDMQRLYFYAGMIYSPDYLDEVVEARHDAIISIDTMSKIVKKVYGKNMKLHRKFKDTESYLQFPLKGLLKCPECNHIIQGRNTTNEQNVIYPYYGCCTKGCKGRANIPQTRVESEFVQYMESLKIPEGVLNLFEAILISNREQKQEGEKDERKKKFIRIEQIEARLHEIEQTIGSIGIPKLRAKMEEERADLDNEKEVLEKTLEDKKYNNTLLLDLLQKVKTMFINPLAFRELGNREMKGMLIDVRFGGNLYYSKKEGYRTKEKTGLHQYFVSICDTIVPSLADDATRTRNQLLGRQGL